MLAISKVTKASKQAKILSKAKLISTTKLSAIKALYGVIASTKTVKRINSKSSLQTKASASTKPSIKSNTKPSTKAKTLSATKTSTTKAKASNKALQTKAKSKTKAKTATTTTATSKNYISLRTANLVPTKNTIIGRFIVENVDSYTRANAGQQALLPLILALFLVIAISNTLSNVPYGYAAASSLSFSLGLSLTVFIAVTASALTLLGVQWFAHFALDSPSFLAPILVLIETISYSARAVSLGVRLFANLVAGHALLNIISKMGKQSILSKWFLLPLIVLPTAILGVIIVLELAVAQIQAYVFTVLTTIYDSESKEKPVFDIH